MFSRSNSEKITPYLLGYGHVGWRVSSLVLALTQLQITNEIHCLLRVVFNVCSIDHCTINRALLLMDIWTSNTALLWCTNDSFTLHKRLCTKIKLSNILYVKFTLSVPGPIPPQYVFLPPSPSLAGP